MKCNIDDLKTGQGVSKSGIPYYKIYIDADTSIRDSILQFLKKEELSVRIPKIEEDNEQIVAYITGFDRAGDATTYIKHILKSGGFPVPIKDHYDLRTILTSIMEGKTLNQSILYEEYEGTKEELDKIKAGFFDDGRKEGERASENVFYNSKDIVRTKSAQDLFVQWFTEYTAENEWNNVTKDDAEKSAKEWYAANRHLEHDADIQNIESKANDVRDDLIKEWQKGAWEGFLDGIKKAKEE